VRITIEPALFEWALERSRKTSDELQARFPRLEAWIQQEARPTLKQAEAFAQATHTPLGLLLLPTAPTDQVPIPDFRTLTAEHPEHPSVNLLDTIYVCQQRQDWYREYARTNEATALPFIGSTTAASPPEEAATQIRRAVNFGLGERRQMGSWSEALRTLIEHVEELGILVMVSGIVGSDTHRVLDPEEFRGLALVDDLAPVIFVNGADTKAAQIFTVVHELAHVWLGQSAVSDVRADRRPRNEAERWCDGVAAEFLVPAELLRDEALRDASVADEAQRLAAQFRVSTLVILRRLRDVGVLSPEDFTAAFSAERERVMAIDRGREPGGNFFNTLPVRASKRFTQAVVASTAEGTTLYRDAFRLLGFRKQKTFDELRRRQGVA
jgi:Zn-dependent peptidase ImmA (M78 family)